MRIGCSVNFKKESLQGADYTESNRLTIQQTNPTPPFVTSHACIFHYGKGCLLFYPANVRVDELSLLYSLKSPK